MCLSEASATRTWRCLMDRSWRRLNLITGNILGGATDKLLDASNDSSELRDNLLLCQGI